MLKIKDNVDLKELEKYGFKGKEYKYDFNDWFRFTRPYENFFVLVNNYTREIVCYDGEAYHKLDLYTNASSYTLIETKEEYIKDLIKDGLVDKVEG